MRRRLHGQWLHHGADHHAPDDVPQFAARLGAQDANCTDTFSNVGAEASDVTLNDVRLTRRTLDT